MWSKGKRSRNKASVGEPADGSLRVILNILKITHTLKSFKTSFLAETYELTPFYFFFFGEKN